MTETSIRVDLRPGAALRQQGEGGLMHRFQHFLVGLTCAPQDASLIRYAGMVARLGTAHEVRFVHVVPSPGHPAAVHDHDRILSQLQDAVRANFNDVPANTRVFCDVLKGPLMDRLLSFAAEQEAELMLVGHRSEQKNKPALARRLAMKAPCSLWMVPEDSHATLNRILVPIDFSDHAADTMQVAVSMARLTGASEILALHVYFNEATATYEEYDQVIRGQERDAFERFIAPIDTRGVTVTPLFEESANVAHGILWAAERHDADLIVMATRGRSRSAAILLGSVTEETMIETRLPLLVVKHYGARMNVLQALLDRRFLTKKGPRFD